MDIKNLVKNVDVKKMATIASAAIMGFVAFSNSIADQKKQAEFDEMKKTLEALTKGKES